jgi:hypothetical protein
VCVPSDKKSAMDYNSKGKLRRRCRHELSERCKQTSWWKERSLVGDSRDYGFGFELGCCQMDRRVGCRSLSIHGSS